MLPTFKDKKVFKLMSEYFSQTKFRSLETKVFEFLYRNFTKFRSLEKEIFEFLYRNFTNHTHTFTIVVSIF
jgi:hypothetical protein